MAFLRSVALPSTTAIAIASAIPVAFALSSSSSSSPSSSRSIRFSGPQNLPSLSTTPTLFPNHLGLTRSFAPAQPLSALHMAGPISEEKPSSQSDAVLPELLTEYMVDMKCEGCVNSVKNKLETVNGVKSVEVDLSNQVVRVLGSTPAKIMTEALEQTGRKARLIGQGVPEDFLISAAVAEFKGPDIFGVVRLAQVNMELARIEPVGDLGTLEADEKGEAFFSGVKQKLKVADLIGRSIAVYRTEDKSDSGVAAAVIARSAGVGENYKKLCTCDGTTIWEATNNDFVTSKV
ncbi:hypothetical protein TIFTF001_003675 [Ficus carica]|uniref:HMA domain-containing protein n=1 Tax=Ficus carica TaxID=3494 RepID=A0AA88CVX1_FICCA|nr:hypothetical protein TIFTF001_003675 [Ficus carica]